MSGPGPASCDYVENVCWSVEERAWKQDVPHLPDDVIALLAPPVIVTASASRYVPRAGTRTA